MKPLDEGCTIIPPPTREPAPILSVRLPRELVDELRRVQARYGWSASEVIEQALRLAAESFGKAGGQ